MSPKTTFAPSRVKVSASRRALSARAAADQRDFPVQLSHGVSPWRGIIARGDIAHARGTHVAPDRRPRRAGAVHRGRALSVLARRGGGPGAGSGRAGHHPGERRPRDHRQGAPVVPWISRRCARDWPAPAILWCRSSGSSIGSARGTRGATCTGGPRPRTSPRRASSCRFAAPTTSSCASSRRS